MKILFMGTPEPAQVCLNALIGAKEELVAVITQPDRPKGRGLLLAPTPVKETALLHDLPVFQPEKLKDREVPELIRGFKPDLIVIVAYGKILPKEILDIPKYGTINVHASLLPKYRGAAPVQRAILNGDKFAGITIMKVTETLDAGAIILQESIPIYETDNTAALTQKLFKLGAQLLVKAVSQIKSGKAVYVEQDEKEVSYAPTLKKEDGVIDWKKKAYEIRNQIRAFDPWPVAYTYYNGKILRIFAAEKCETGDATRLPASRGELARQGCEAGRIIEIRKNKGFIVGVCDGALLVTEVQFESGRKMSAWEFLMGHKIKVGDILPN
ncbi:MAG: methionyl-tRNA formyltransferase [bacterium]